MMRLKDYRCETCGEIRRDIVIIDGESPMVACHQYHTMVPLVGAPMVFYKPHYSHALGKRVNRYTDEERELAKKGQWIASKTEANRVYDTDIFKDDVTVKPATPEKIKRSVEKAAAELAKDGLISFKY